MINCQIYCSDFIELRNFPLKCGAAIKMDNLWDCLKMPDIMYVLIIIFFNGIVFAMMDAIVAYK